MAGSKSLDYLTTYTPDSELFWIGEFNADSGSLALQWTADTMTTAGATTSTYTETWGTGPAPYVNPSNTTSEVGYSFGPTAVTDQDGLNDAAEFNLRSLGFKWQDPQPGLVATLFTHANGAGLFSASQVQTLHSGTPIISRNPTNGKVKLTMDWKKSTDLATFSDFPATPLQVSVNGGGDIEFEFTPADNAAFFRLQSN